MSRLDIRLLGLPSVTWAGHPVSILRGPSACAASIAWPRRRPRCACEHLRFLFWADSPETTARRNLSHVLTHLRISLPRISALTTVDDHIGLNPELVWSDAQEFICLCTLAEDGHFDALQQAVDLYRGPFLEGVSIAASPQFETWATLERCAWERRYLQAMTTLIDQQSAGGQLEGAIVNAQRYLTVDRLDEDMHRRLMQLYDAHGDQQLALHQYQICVTVLERELSVTPLPETQAVYQAILGQWLDRHMAAPVKPQWTTLPGPDVALVGRGESWSSFIERIVKCWSAAVALCWCSARAASGNRACSSILPAAFRITC